MADNLAELKALRAHVIAVNEALAPQGFTMAGDTKLRLGEADKLIAQADKSGVDDAWSAKAVPLADLLRAECGK